MTTTPPSRGSALRAASTRLQPAARSIARRFQKPRWQTIPNLVASAALASVALHCGDKDHGATTSKAQATSMPAVEPQPAGITTIGELDRREVHLDELGAPSIPLPRHATPKRPRSLELILRSTPSGAIAAVDGVPVGQTPMLWQGEFTGREREFTFTAAGFATARYRFVPTTDGIVHGRLSEAGSNADKRRVREGTPSALIPAGAPQPPAEAPPTPPAAPPAPSGTMGGAEPAQPSLLGPNDARPPNGGPGTAPTQPGTAGSDGGPAATAPSGQPSPSAVTPAPLPPPVSGAAAAPAPAP